MKQIITAKLKIHLSPDQKESLRQVRLPYRDALNYSSGIGFEPRKISINYTLHKLVYSDIYDLREKISILSQITCYFSLKLVANLSNNKVHDFQGIQQLIKKIPFNKISNKSDKLITFNSDNCYFKYQIYLSFKTG